MHDPIPKADAVDDPLSIQGVGRRGPVVITYEGTTLPAYAGESVAAALLRAGVTAFRRTAKMGAARGYYCGMGVCFECLVEVDGVGGLRACRTEVRMGMTVRMERT